MKFYVLRGVIKGRQIKEKVASSRRSGEIKLEKILAKNGLQVEENYFSSKHTEEFVCDARTRFSISRVVVEC